MYVSIIVVQGRRSFVQRVAGGSLGEKNLPTETLLESGDQNLERDVASQEVLNSGGFALEFGSGSLGSKKKRTRWVWSGWLNIFVVY